MRHILHKLTALILLATTSAGALAQDDEYYNNSWYSCDLTSRQTIWAINKYKANISNIFPMQEDHGSVTFSDDCIEINCENMQMHFPVKQYNRLTQFSFSVERNGEDDYFNYIEVAPNRAGTKNTYKVMVAFLDPDGIMQNTHVIICRTKDGKFPPQVPDL